MNCAIHSYWQRLLLSLAVLCTLAMIATPFFVPQQSSKDYLPIVMILADKDTGLYSSTEANSDPMYTMLKCSIESQLMVIVSTPVLYWLTKRTAEGRNSDFDWAQAVEKRYVVQLTKGNKFALLTPNKYAKKLNELGFNLAYLGKPMRSAEKLKQCFEHQRYAHQAINPQELEDMLRKQTPTDPVCPKYWYITGHGLDTIDETIHEWHDAVMAQMPIYDMVNVLQTLNETNTQMVYLLSCYAAGSNLLKLQHLCSAKVTDERCKTIKPLNYPILMQCTMDTASTRIAGRYFSLPGLFEAMVQWKNLATTDCSLLAQKIGALYAQAPRDERFSNYPTLRLPGASSNFQALELPTTTVIRSPVRTAQTITIPKVVDMIQVYPAEARKLTLLISSCSLPNLMSRVPGRAHHFIGTINIHAQGSLTAIIESVFLNGLFDGDTMLYGVADKAWFVDTLISNKKTLAQGLVVCKGSIKKAKPSVSVVYKGANNTYYRINAPLNFQGLQTKAVQIDEETYKNAVKQIYWETLPEQDALDEATHRVESRHDHARLLTEFGDNLSLEIIPPASKELIEHDLREIECEKMEKKNFLYSTIHSHNKELVQAVINAACEHRIFTHDDCMILLVNLLDDESQELALEQIHTLTQQKDPALVSVAIDCFSYLVQQERPQQVLAAYDDIMKYLHNVIAQNKLHPRLISNIQDQLAQCMVMFINNDYEQIATQKIKELLHSPELGIQAVGATLVADVQEAGYADDS